jgi:hypothetical protein
MRCFVTIPRCVMPLRRAGAASRYEAAQMESPDGRANYATAVTQGIVTYLSAKITGS